MHNKPSFMWGILPCLYGRMNQNLETSSQRSFAEIR